MNRRQKIDEIKNIVAGVTTLKGDCVPLFWERDQHGNFVAGDFKLNQSQFEKLNKKTPCYL